MSLPDTELTEQYITNRSYDPTYEVEMVELVGYDSASGVLRPLAVTDTGLLKVSV